LRSLAAKGTFSLCIDVELAWGTVHRRRIDLEKLTGICKKARDIFDPLRGLLEKYEVPATWAILGHIMLDHCECINGKPHSDMPRANYPWLKEDWYRYDPCSSMEVAPQWYGKDIVDRLVNYVKNSKLPHDVACHSFSHQMFGDTGCSREVAEAEIRKCIELFKREYDLTPKVFTFPRDYVGHVDVLKDNGFIAYRDTIPKLYPCLYLQKSFSTCLKTSLSLFAQALSYYILWPPHVVEPKNVGGLWAVPGCLAYGEKRMIPFRLVTLKAMQGVKKSVKEGKIFCLNTHLIEFALNNIALQDLEKILLYVSKEKNRGVLLIKTIRQIVSESIN